jgi:hypothetical protein
MFVTMPRLQQNGCRQAEEAAGVSPSWVNVESKGMGFGDIKVWEPLAKQEVVNNNMQKL